MPAHQLPSTPAGVDASHCTAPFWTGSRPDNSRPGRTLDYHLSDGPWFERLCYRLGWRQGYAMRYFGRQGLEQYGADLVGTKDGETVVWQCKNVGSRPEAKEIREWVCHFCTKWVAEQDLPPPNRFILCFPQPMDDTPTDCAWQELVAIIKKEPGIALELWDRKALDEMLRAAPDIVADLFDDKSAEWYCGLDSWRPDLFRPLSLQDRPDVYPDRLRRYGDALANGRLYVAPQHLDKLGGLSDTTPIVLVRGAPGSGKTFSVLSYCRQQAEAGWRTYYLNLFDTKDNAANIQITEGLQRRQSSPTICVIDDCHGLEDRLTDVIDRLGITALAPKLRIICLARHVKAGSEREREGHSGWTETMEAAGAVLDIDNGDDFLKGYVERLRPDFKGLSERRWEHLFALTGRNLLLLDVFLASNPPPEWLDKTDRKDLYGAFRQHGLRNRTKNAEQLWRLAALAQFELAPPADWISGDLESMSAEAGGFVTLAGWPRRLYFVHSSAAELAFHALATTNPLAPALGEILREYLGRQIEAARKDVGRRESCLDETRRILATRLILLSPKELASAHALWIEDADISTTLLEWAMEAGGHPLIGMVPIILGQLEWTERIEEMARPFAGGMATWLERYAASSVPIPSEKTYLFHWFASRLARFFPESWTTLEDAIDAGRWIDAIHHRSAFPELLRLLEVATPGFSQDLLAALPQSTLDALIGKTLGSDRSIGTLHFALKALGEKSPKLLATLESKCAPERWLDLISANGTVFELFKLIEYSSPDFAAGLIEALSQEILDGLIEKTRSSGRSIATLHLSLFELGRKFPGLLAALESKSPPGRWLELISANGTVFELFKLIQYSSPDFAGRLIKSLSQEVLDGLIEKTRSSGRSIGTLDLTLMALGDKSPELLAALESNFPPGRWLELISANGTVFELFKLIEHSSVDFTGRLIEALSPEILDGLIEKTRSSGRSIGTINYPLRKLAQRAPALRESLQTTLGAGRFTNLILGVGTLGNFADLAEALGDDFRLQVLADCAGRPDQEWKDLANRSSFFELAEFLARSRRWITQEDEVDQKLMVLAACAPHLAKESSWYALNTGHRLAAAHRDAPWHGPLADAVSQRLLAAKAADLPPGAETGEVANAASLLISKRQDLIPDVISRIAEALCPTDPRDSEDYTRWAPGLLFQLHNPTLFTKDKATACLDAMLGEAATALFLEEGDDVRRFHWIWNALAVHWERCQPGSTPAQAAQAFRQSRPSSFWNALLEAWLRRTEEAKGWQHIAAVLQLAGIYALMGLKLPFQKRLRWENFKELHFSLGKALFNDNLGFVPTWFLQFGARAMLNDRQAFTEERRQMLEEKLAKYELPISSVQALAGAMAGYAVPAGSSGFSRNKGVKRPHFDSSQSAATLPRS